MFLATNAGNAVDVIVLIVIALAFVYGIIRGFVLQLAGIVFLIGGIVLAGRYGGAFGDVLQGWFSGLGDPINDIVAFCLIVVGTMLGGHVLALIFRGVLEKLKLMSYDRFLGGVLGALKGALVVGLVLYGLVALFGREDEEEGEPLGFVAAIEESRSWPLVESARDIIAPLIPEKERDRLKELEDKAREKARDATRKAAEPSSSD